MKTVEEYGDGELLGFNAVATKLLGVVTAPIQNALINKQPQVHHRRWMLNVHVHVLCMPQALSQFILYTRRVGSG